MRHCTSEGGNTLGIVALGLINSVSDKSGLVILVEVSLFHH
jgi:hypothetical protein